MKDDGPSSRRCKRRTRKPDEQTAVIDDDLSTRTNLVELFEMEGFEVIGAENGRAGLQLARQHLPDLIVCDIMMPELDGYGVLEELRQDFATATIPLIFLTANADLRQGKLEDLRANITLALPHELRTPLTGILGSSELLLKEAASLPLRDIRIWRGISIWRVSVYRI
jgi:CheY-like chemotaxis protein